MVQFLSGMHFGVAHGCLTGRDTGSHQQPCILHPMAACLKLVSVPVADPSTPTRTEISFCCMQDARLVVLAGAQPLVPVQGHLCLPRVTSACAQSVVHAQGLLPAQGSSCTRAATCTGAITCKGSFYPHRGRYLHRGNSCNGSL